MTPSSNNRKLNPGSPAFQSPNVQVKNKSKLPDDYAQNLKQLCHLQHLIGLAVQRNININAEQAKLTREKKLNEDLIEQHTHTCFQLQKKNLALFEKNVEKPNGAQPAGNIKL